MLNFQVARAKKFQLKMNFFALPTNMEWRHKYVKNLEKIIRGKYRRSTTHFALFKNVSLILTS